VGGVDWKSVNPKSYSHVIFTCGPFGNGWPLTEFLSHFKGSNLIGIDLSMLDSLETWNPFHTLIERDSSRTSNPDISFLSKLNHVPVVGVILANPQKEYGANAGHQDVNDVIEKFLSNQKMSIVRIDTRLDINNAYGLRTPAEIESLIAKMDIVITTRLHGLVLALKNQIPVVAIDAIHGGAKVRRQAETIGWPIILGTNDLTNTTLQQSFDFCLSDKAKKISIKCRETSIFRIIELKQEFQQALLNASL